MPKSNLSRKIRLGYIVFSILIVIKVAEYFATKVFPRGAWPYLTILALIGACPILYYFMHINQLKRSGGKDEQAG